MLETNPPYQPKTEFGEAVAMTGFGRVCPGCGAKWCNQVIWLKDTIQVDSITKTVRGHLKTQVPSTDGIHKYQWIDIPAIFVIRINVRRHECGGEMLDEGREISRSKLESCRLITN